MLFTLNITPVSLSLSTEIGPAIIAPDVGFLYSKLIFYYFCFYL